jgi:hypothetical protein
VETHGSVNRWAGDCVGGLFSGVLGFIQLYWVSTKGCHIQLVMSTYVLCVSGFSYRIYIDLNHRDSRIWVTDCLVTVST